MLFESPPPNPGNEAPPGRAGLPPNGPDYGSTPPFTGAAPPFGMPPFPGMPPFAPSFGMAAFPGMDMMMSQMTDRAAFLHRCMITMSNLAAEISQACQLLAQSPVQFGSPFGSPFAASAPAQAVPGDRPVDLEALKQALAGMDPIQSQKTLYAVQMMQWFAGMTRGNTPPAADPVKPW